MTMPTARQTKRWGWALAAVVSAGATAAPAQGQIPVTPAEECSFETTASLKALAEAGDPHASQAYDDCVRAPTGMLSGPGAEGLFLEPEVITMGLTKAEALALSEAEAGVTAGGDGLAGDGKAGGGALAAFTLSDYVVFPYDRI